MNKLENKNTVCIIGAGLSGSMLAIMLSNRGFKVDLYEKRPDVRKKAVSGNRTIAMSLSHRGIKCLERVNLGDAILNNTIPKHSRTVHKEDGSYSIQRYGRNGHTINTVDRCELNSILLNRAEKFGMVEFFPNTECELIDPDTGKIAFKSLEDNKTTEKTYKWIIGADGIFSNVRKNLESKKLIKSVLRKAKHGYRELVIPADENKDYRLDKQSVHVWPRSNYILVGLPSHDGYFTCNLFLPAEGELSLKEIKTENQILELFKRDFSKVMPLMPNLVDDYFNNSASEIMTVKCESWNYKDKVLLIGDAAHAIVPFFAMGMNAGFEDCTVFDDLMTEYKNDLSKVIEHFGNLRKPDTDAISDLSFDNFNEISKSPNPNYHKIWEMERSIWEMFPDKWMPLYPMIAFSHIPFTEVIKRNDYQKNIINNILNSGNWDANNLLRMKELVIEQLEVIEPISSL